MAKRIQLNVPDIGEADRIELVTWNVASGSKVQMHQELCELVKDKAAFPLESPYDGRLVEVVAGPGSIVKVGDLLAVLEVESKAGDSPAL